MAHILVVDDEANIRMMIRLALEKAGHTVELAVDGPEAIAKFGQGQDVDLVLLDQRMPGMEGLDVLRELRSRKPDARVVMITAFGTVDLASDAMKAGAGDFLRKPFTLNTLWGAVAAALLGDVRAPQSSHHTPPKGERFALSTFNGFRLETLRYPARRRHNEIRQMLDVQCPDGHETPVEIILAPDFIASVKEDTGLQHPLDDETFWQCLCEEALVNYLWQNPMIPFGGLLKVDEYTTHLRRWVFAWAADGGYGSHNAAVDHE